MYKYLLIILVLSISLSSFSQIRLPKLISNGMVLQRDVDVKLWGWASVNEDVELNFNKRSFKSKANSDGKWDIILPSQISGGPFSMQFMASDTVTIDSIYFGEVWLCSGQSNMEINMQRVSPIYGNEIASANYPEIRYFHVPRTYDFNIQHEDLASGEWKAVTPKNALSFSAVSYFFGLELYEKYNVPIGLINSALGGSPIESWINEDHLKAFPDSYKELQKFKNQEYVNQVTQSDKDRENKWHATINKLDEGYENQKSLWKDAHTSTDDWNKIQMPGYFPEQKNGVIWVKRNFEVSKTMTGLSAKLDFGCIVDADSIYINGIFIGNTTYRYPPRRYTIPEDVLTAGTNTIAVRVISRIEPAGFVEDKHYKISCNNETIDLNGEWDYKYGVEMDALQPQTFIRWKPAGLYNAMIAPLTNYTIKGALWYQGESNIHNVDIYDDLLQTMVKNWRKSWKQENLPIIVAQLPNYLMPKSEPNESSWALMRESQLKVLQLKNTALTVNIDLGEWNDIHPLNKKDVSYRLALAAKKVAYNNDKIVYSGPIYESMEIRDNKIILSFSNIGSGLLAKNEVELNEFAIAGVDKIFIWAQAKIEGDKIIVWSDKIKNPIAVRYAWADNPDNANLYNIEGLPASPFRSDEW